MITFCAPESRCSAALSRAVKSPVDSSTMSTPSMTPSSATAMFSALPGKRRLIVAWENQRAVMEDCAEAMKRFKVAVREMQMRTGWRPGPEGE